ncbi:MAG: hypothetical protein ACK4S4_00300 [Pyrinomonadaceae bacterium]
MMLVKIYWSLWGLIALSVIVVEFTVGLGLMAAVVYGFICFGMIFMGMIGVLPSSIARAQPAEPKAKVPAAKPAAADSARHSGVLKNA